MYNWMYSWVIKGGEDANECRGRGFSPVVTLRVLTVMENPGIGNHPGKSWKSHGFLSFSKKSWKTAISRKKSWNFAETISFMHDIRLWQSSSLHLQVHCFPSHSFVHVL